MAHRLGLRWNDCGPGGFSARNFLTVTGIALVAMRTPMVVIHPMTNPYHASSVQTCGVLPQFTPIARLIKGVAVILTALLLQITGEVRGQTSQSSYLVKFAWNASPSTGVTGYRIHYGTSAGTYTASIAVGNVTSGTVTGLAEGVTYHFAVSALNAAGSVSGYSNAVSFKPGLHTSQIRTTTIGKNVLFVRGLIGRQYDIEASADLKKWTIISTVSIPTGGALEFSDPNAGSYPMRFYRTRPRP